MPVGTKLPEGPVENSVLNEILGVLVTFELIEVTSALKPVLVVLFPGPRLTTAVVVGMRLIVLFMNTRLCVIVAFGKNDDGVIVAVMLGRLDVPAVMETSLAEIVGVEPRD